MTGKKLTREHLKLVSDFSRSQYPYFHVVFFEDHLDNVDRHEESRVLKDAIRLAGIKDYRLFDNHYNIELCLRTEEELDRLNVALSPDGEIHQGFATAPEGYDWRKLKNMRHELQNIIRKTPLVGQIHIDVDREERSIVVIAQNKKAYFEFRQLMADTPTPSF